MTRIITTPIAILALLIACASGTPATPADARAQIEQARAIGRPLLTIALATRGVPAASTAAALAEIDPLIDAALDGKDIAALLQPAALAALRAELLPKVSAALVKNSKAKDGTLLLDQASADVFAGQFLDAFGSALKTSLQHSKGATPQ